MADVGVIGAGYVGMATALGFARLGHRVVIGEADPDRVEALRSGTVPFYEPGMSQLFSEVVAKEFLSFTGDNAEAATGRDAVYVCVPTPEGDDGRVDLAAMEQAVRSIAVAAGTAPIVIKSSIPPGTSRLVSSWLEEEGSIAPIVINPEFLQEGSAIRDVTKPKRIVIGSDDRAAAEVVAKLHQRLGAPVVMTDPTSAELTKYASNAMLATRLTFVNAVAHFAEAVGADVADVLTGMGYDPRIGRHYLRPGPGYGGSCFPKDLRALVKVADDLGHDFQLLEAVVATNDQQLDRVVAKLVGAIGDLQGKTVALWGLAFKGGTGDTRSSPAVELAKKIVAAGGSVVAADPKAEVDLEGVSLASDPVAAAAGADAILVATEWEDFTAIDPHEVRAVVTNPVVIDARNLLDKDAYLAAGFDYRGLGR